MDASAYFRGKKITVMGLGLLGRGVGDAEYLAECGAELVVTDLKSKEQLAESVARLERFPNITFVLGEHRLEDFRDRDLILKAAGVPLDSPYVAEAKEHGIPVRMSADLFMEHAGIPAIGVTGTRGKSTVTHMIAAILEEAGKKALLGGNVRGVSTLALLKEATPEHVAALELDSWQCQGLGEASLSPQIAVFTTFFQDHLNYYKSDPGQYLADKANIFLYQSPDDTLVMGKQCAATLIEAFGEHIVAHAVVADESKLPSDWTLRIPGIHNRYDAALALSAARAFGIDDATSKKALESFRGVPGRLELLGEEDGVRIYNDNNSTTPEATLAALDALGAENTILIMGGADKGLDMNALLARLPGVKKVVLLAGTGTERIKSELPETAVVFDSLEEAVSAARSAAERGDIILFSPAFASFGMFKNEYDRNDRFVALARPRS
ncbi:MAG TPA: UDP-N-acetylmuramoyl-L-alanine--D-glutamate ligase [Candidatus Paceibacterota bacterium]|nr:UDP-N-acetylmuramoyl-L-alanine--D-glutamate ligase [Candidatus Paceibacterota bacterium]